MLLKDFKSKHIHSLSDRTTCPTTVVYAYLLVLKTHACRLCSLLYGIDKRINNFDWTAESLNILKSYQFSSLVGSMHCLTKPHTCLKSSGWQGDLSPHLLSSMGTVQHLTHLHIWTHSSELKKNLEHGLHSYRCSVYLQLQLATDKRITVCVFTMWAHHTPAHTSQQPTAVSHSSLCILICQIVAYGFCGTLVLFCNLTSFKGGAKAFLKLLVVRQWAFRFSLRMNYLCRSADVSLKLCLEESKGIKGSMHYFFCNEPQCLLSSLTQVVHGDTFTGNQIAAL